MGTKNSHFTPGAHTQHRAPRTALALPTRLGSRACGRGCISPGIGDACGCKGRRSETGIHFNVALQKKRQLVVAPFRERFRAKQRKAGRSNTMYIYMHMYTIYDAFNSSHYREQA